MPPKTLVITGLANPAPLTPSRFLHIWRPNPGFWPFDTTASMWFELHSRRYLKTHGPNFPKATELVVALSEAPVMWQDASEWRVALGVSFPRAEVESLGGYHASSFDWLLALGILVGYRSFYLTGIGFGPTDGGEPLSARACLEYWIGYARGKGCTVDVSEPTGLFWNYNYSRTKTPYHYDDTWRLVEDR